MKFTIEIPDEEIEKCLQAHVKKLTEYRYNTEQSLLFKLLEKAVNDKLSKHNWLPMVEERIHRVAEKQIDAIAANKTEGFIKQRIKDLLKFAHFTYFDQCKQATWTNVLQLTREQLEQILSLLQTTVKENETPKWYVDLNIAISQYDPHYNYAWILQLRDVAEQHNITEQFDAIIKR